MLLFDRLLKLDTRRCPLEIVKREISATTFFIFAGNIFLLTSRASLETRYDFESLKNGKTLISIFKILPFVAELHSHSS